METQPEARRSMDRQTAMKVWIRNLVNGRYVSNPGWEPNHVQAGELKLSRANIMGAVVQKSDSKVLNYDYLVIDDGTGRIMVRAFEDRGMLKDFRIGDLLNIIGKPREYADEIYLVPEMARRVDDPLWVEVRKLELAAMPLLAAKEAGEPEAAEQAVEDERIVTPLDHLLAVIRERDRGDGVEVDDILPGIKEGEQLLQSLLMRGDIFEIRPGRVKVLE